jgi:multicomponent Na+:H+ antiporter subunit B
VTSLILQVATRYILPLLLLFSVFLLFRGHNNPGGGFVAGLVAASAYVLLSIAYGTKAARHSLHINPRSLIGIGLLVVLASGAIGPLKGQPWFTGMWLHIPWSDETGVHIGTPLLFDVGVYITVIGAVLTVILTLEEEA